MLLDVKVLVETVEVLVCSEFVGWQTTEWRAHLSSQSSKQLRLEASYMLLVEAEGLVMLTEDDRAHQQSNSDADPYMPAEMAVRSTGETATDLQTAQVVQVELQSSRDCCEQQCIQDEFTKGE